MGCVVLVGLRRRSKPLQFALPASLSASVASSLSARHAIGAILAEAQNAECSIADCAAALAGGAAQLHVQRALFLHVRHVDFVILPHIGVFAQKLHPGGT